jgi:CDP-paratose 2-epimerase
MRILITGGAGMVGSHAAEYYAGKKNEVIVLDNLIRSRLFGYDRQSVEYNWNWLGDFKNVKRIKGDVRSTDDVYGALGDGVDAIVHAAAQPGVSFSVRMPQEDFSINALGTLNVLECARQRCKDAVFIYCSTNKVYGENVDRIPIKEEKTRYAYKTLTGVSEEMSVDYGGHTPYGVSKYAGDMYVQEYHHIYGMKTGVFRMSCIYGTRQFGFEDQGWVAWFLIANLLGRPLTIYGDGKQVRDLLYVDDLMEAYDKFINSDVRHGVFNIGGGPDNTVSLLEFISLIEKQTAKKMNYSFADWRPSDQKVYISQVLKAKKILKWQPRTDIAEGLNRLFEWVQDNINMFK